MTFAYERFTRKGTLESRERDPRDLRTTANSVVDGSHPTYGPSGQFVGGHSAEAALVGNFMWVVAIAGWLLTMGSLAVVARRVNPPPETLRFGRTVSVLTSLSLSLTFVAYLVWRRHRSTQSRVACCRSNCGNVSTTRRLAPYGVWIGFGVRCIDLGRDNGTSIMADYLLPTSLGHVAR